MKRENGITMITLAVTIIVLIILAGVSISTLVGDNGIITKAKQARENILYAGQEEQEQLNQLFWELEQNGSYTEDEEDAKKDQMIELLQKQVEELKQQVADLQNENTELQEQVADLNKQIEDLNNQINDLKEQIEEKDIQIADLQKEVAAKQETINDLQGQLDSLNSQLAQTNATAAHILKNYKAYSGGKLLVGTMANNGAVSASLNAGQSYTIPEGYHNGSGKVTANSLASQTQGTATAEDIAEGKIAYVNGQKVIGTGKNFSGGIKLDGYSLQFSTSVSGVGLTGSLSLYKDGNQIGTQTFSGSVYSLTINNPMFSFIDKDTGHRVLVNMGYSSGTGYGNFSFQYEVDGVEITTFTSNASEYAGRNESYTAPAVVIYDGGMYRYMAESKVNVATFTKLQGYTLDFSTSVSGAAMSGSLTFNKDGASLGTQTFSGSVYSISITNPMFSVVDKTTGSTVVINMGYSAGTGYGNFSFQYVVDGTLVTTFTSNGGEYVRRSENYTAPEVLFYETAMYQRIV